MRGNYVIGCPGTQPWEYALMFLGFLALLFLFTLAYQLAAEKFVIYRAVRRRRLAESHGD